MLLHKQKFFQLISVLNDAELEKFNDYLLYGQQGISKKEQLFLTKLINILLKNRSDFTQINIEKLVEEVFQLTSRDIRQKLSKFYKEVQFFWGAQTIFEKAALPEEIQLSKKNEFLAFLLERRCYNLFEQDYKKHIKELSLKKKCQWVYDLELKAEELQIQYQISNNNKKKDVDLNRLFKLNARSDFLGLLKYICHHKSLSLGRNKKEIAINLAPVFLNIDEKAACFEDDLLIKLYVNLYRVFDNQIAADVLFDLLQKHGHKIELHDIRGIVTHLKNQCLQNTWMGTKEGNNVLLGKIIAYEVDQNLIVPKKMSIINFLNFVNQAAKSGNFDWGQQFIKDYNAFLPKSNQQKISSIGQAILLFEQGHYKESLDIIDHPKMRFDYSESAAFFDKALENNRQTLIIKAFYELKDLHTALARVTVYRAHLKKTASKLNTQYVTSNTLFLQSLEKLIKYRIQNMYKEKLAEKLNKLRNFVEDSLMNNKEWLLTKIDEV